MAAAPVKTLRYILPAAEASLDPAQGRDLYTGHITEAIFETLYTYDYLARPVRLAAAAAALPQVSADGLSVLIRLKPGIYFTPDPAFGGQRRELTVADYLYSWKRLFDPQLASPNSWLLEGRIVGLDAGSRSQTAWPHGLRRCRGRFRAAGPLHFASAPDPARSQPGHDTGL
jgi:ABC-type transport system substrate-binding protein